MLNFDWAKRTHKGLRKWIMYIVRDSSKTGAEIMDVMESNLQGWWRPSPGSVYPLLKKMVEEGYLTESNHKYSLTEMGRLEVDRPWPWFDGGVKSPKSVEGIVEELSSYTSYLEDLSEAKDTRVADNAIQLREIGKRLSMLGESS